MNGTLGVNSIPYLLSKDLECVVANKDCSYLQSHNNFLNPSPVQMYY